MEFPRVGLIRDIATGAIIATWNYPLTEGMEDVITGDPPLLDFDPGAHEMVDLTKYSDEQYVMIKEKHHETLVEMTVVETKEVLEFTHQGKGGAADTIIEIGRPEKEPPPEDPKDPPVDPKDEEIITEVSNP